MLTPLVVSVVLAQAWSLDVSKTELVVKVWKTGAAAGMAHDHVVRATKLSGRATLADDAKPESLTLELAVDVASLVPDEPEVRKRYAIAGAAVPDADRAKVKENMLGVDQLDAAKFPTIGFTVTRVVRDERGALLCTGKLTLHGVTKELTFPIAVKVGETVEGDAQVKVKTSDFGVQPFSAALGLIRNKDEVELLAHISLAPSTRD
jgi:polyisoprenoid-binding protein YceI